MRIEELTPILESFVEEAMTNLPSLLRFYKIEVNLIDGRQHVELYSDIRRNRKLIRSTPIDEYDIKDLIWTTSRCAQPLRQNEWFLSWRKSTKREYRLRQLGI